MKRGFPMSKSSWAKRRMRENRNNQFRPEQIKLYQQIRATRANSSIIMEHTIHDEDKRIVAVADIADLTRKEIFRINGQIHHSREQYDADQKVKLEELGWKVTDINIEE